jgi:hypothetical protein
MRFVFVTVRLVRHRVVRVPHERVATMRGSVGRLGEIHLHDACVHDAGRESEHPCEQHMQGEAAKSLNLHRRQRGVAHEVMAGGYVWSTWFS